MSEHDTSVFDASGLSAVMSLPEALELANSLNLPYPRVAYAIPAVYEGYARGWLFGRTHCVSGYPTGVSRIPQDLEQLGDEASNNFLRSRRDLEALNPRWRLVDTRNAEDFRFVRRGYFVSVARARGRRHSLLPQGPATAASEWDQMHHMADLRVRRELGQLVRQFIHDPDPTEQPMGSIFSRLLTLTNSGYDGVIRRVSDAIEDACGESVVRYECGHVGFESDGQPTVDGDVCQSCHNSYYVECEDEQYHHRDHVYYWSSDDEYHTSPEPEGDDDDDSSDDDSSDGESPDCRMEYSTDVMRFLSVDSSFETTAAGDFHMGVELETVLSEYVSIDGKVREVREELGEDYLVAKSDGSIGDRGIEWVTRPTSLAVHIHTLKNWGESRSGLKAWDPGRCGMHVHIDSRAFTSSSLGKMIAFYNRVDNAEFIRNIAGRHPIRDEQARRYADSDINEECTADPIKALKGKPHSNRYVMVNTSNLRRSEMERLRIDDDDSGRGPNTVEVRIFRASMRKERMLAQLEFTHAAVIFCRETGYRNVAHTDFLKWLPKHVRQYPWLAEFLGVQPHKHGAQRQTAVEELDEATV